MSTRSSYYVQNSWQKCIPVLKGLNHSYWLSTNNLITEFIPFTHPPLNLRTNIFLCLILPPCNVEPAITCPVLMTNFEKLSMLYLCSLPWSQTQPNSAREANIIDNLNFRTFTRWCRDRSIILSFPLFCLESPSFTVSRFPVVSSSYSHSLLSHSSDPSLSHFSSLPIFLSTIPSIPSSPSGHSSLVV